MEVIRYNGGAVLIKIIAGDGHCLFSAIPHQLYKTDIRSEEHNRRIWETRGQIAEYIKHNLQSFHNILIASINEPEATVSGSTEQEQIQSFLHNLQTTREWGGTETVIAAAELF